MRFKWCSHRLETLPGRRRSEEGKATEFARKTDGVKKWRRIVGKMI